MPKKKRKLFDHFVDAQKEYDSPCNVTGDTLQMCPTLTAVVGVHNEDGGQPGFEIAPMFQIGTRKSLGSKLVYFARRAEYVEVNYCPFCGKKVRAKRNAVVSEAG